MSNSIKFLINRLSRKTAIILIVAMLFDMVGIPLGVPRARAANPNMLLFWDGGAAPPGWTIVSDGVGEPFYGGIFPRGNSSYTANNGSMGATSHTHTGTASGGTPQAGTAKKSAAGTTYNDNAHTHTGTVGSVNSPTNASVPAYKDLQVIRYGGIPTGASAIPDGAIAVFDTSVPSGWSDISASFGTNFIRGAATAGGTGGNNSHGGAAHTVSSIALNQNTTNVNVNSGTNNANAATLVGHFSAHTVANQTSNTPDSQPPYQTIVLGQKSGDGVMPQGMIAMFDGATFDNWYGWETLSNSGGPFYQNFLKVTGAYGSPAGGTTHTHANMTPNSASAGGSASSGNGNGSISNHYHIVTVALADGTNTNIPPYTDVVFAKNAYEYTTLTANNAPGLGDTVTVDTTVTNNSATSLTGTHVKYVIFIDSNANGYPESGDTYITANCAGSDTWASMANYTWEVTGKDAASGGGTATDQQSCTNNNFPSDTTYTVYAQWHASDDSITYATKYVTFSSIPTLGQLLFMVLIGGVVFIGYRQGVIKLSSKDRKSPRADSGRASSGRMRRKK